MSNAGCYVSAAACASAQSGCSFSPTAAWGRLSAAGGSCCSAAVQSPHAGCSGAATVAAAPGALASAAGSAGVAWPCLRPGMVFVKAACQLPLSMKSSMIANTWLTVRMWVPASLTCCWMGSLADLMPCASAQGTAGCPARAAGSGGSATHHVLGPLEADVFVAIAVHQAADDVHVLRA